MGIFNIYATVQADANLLLQTAILLVLGLSWGFKRRNKYLEHGIIMGTAVTLHTVSIFIAMIPFLLINPGLFANLLNRLTLVMLPHSVLGALVEILGVYLVGVWALNRGVSKTCFKNKRIMKATIALWLIEFAVGTYVYMLLYLPT